MSCSPPCPKNEHAVCAHTRPPASCSRPRSIPPCRSSHIHARPSRGYLATQPRRASYGEHTHSFLAASPGLLRLAFSTVPSALSEQPRPVVRVRKPSSHSIVVVKTCARLVSIATRMPGSNNQNIEPESRVSHPCHPTYRATTLPPKAARLVSVPLAKHVDT